MTAFRRGYIVPGASHERITLLAWPGRGLVAVHQVESRLLLLDSYRRDIVSQLDLRFAPGYRPHVPRVDQHDRVVGLQQVEHRSPVDAGALHGHLLDGIA